MINMQKAAMTVTIKELRRIADELEKEIGESPLNFPDDWKNVKWLYPIINKDGCSDSWKFDGRKK
jgi:hypothetical protein